MQDKSVLLMSNKNCITQNWELKYQNYSKGEGQCLQGASQDKQITDF